MSLSQPRPVAPSLSIGSSSALVDSPQAAAAPLQAHSNVPHWAMGTEASVLPRIYEDTITISVLQRALPAVLEGSAQAQCHSERLWSFQWLGPANTDMKQALLRSLPAAEQATALIDDVLLLTEAMGMLFDTDSLGVRLRLMNAAMCPRFHCDKLPVRMVTTYVGAGSEWLPEFAVNRQGLGAPTPDKPDVLREPSVIRALAPGDLALLKGDGWAGNEGRGLVHRSPAVASGGRRLLLTIDPA